MCPLRTGQHIGLSACHDRPPHGHRRFVNVDIDIIAYEKNLSMLMINVCSSLLRTVELELTPGLLRAKSSSISLKTASSSAPMNAHESAPMKNRDSTMAMPMMNAGVRGITPAWARGLSCTVTGVGSKVRLLMFFNLLGFLAEVVVVALDGDVPEG